MRLQRALLLGLLAVGTLLGQLLLPVGGYTVVVGDSMDPTIPAGCSVVGAHAWDGDSSLEGEIVAFRAEDLTRDTAASATLPIDPWVAHRVVAEYDPYDPATANHTLTKNGLLAVETEPRTTLLATEQTYAEATALEGERVLVLKGDNNQRIDPVLVSEDDVLGVVDADRQVLLQDLESWPCSRLAPR